jgi:hypothetical protein
MQPLTGRAALERHYLEARSLLLDLAAILDRIDRGGGSDDPRLELFQQALKVLEGAGPGRAEKIQHIFSLAYEPSWEKPKPRA